MQLEFLLRLYRHMEWADALIWRTTLSNQQASRDAYVLDSLFHLHMVQRAHLAVWKGEEFAMPSRDDFPDPVDIRDWAQAYYAQAPDFVAELPEERLDEIVSLPSLWTDFIEKELGRSPSLPRLGDMVLQVPLHSVHHRAQINRRIREVGGSPSMVDYIGWIWQGEPPPDWPD